MTVLLVFAAVFALLDWYAVFHANTRIERIAKPAAMIFLILWYETTLPAAPPAASSWFLVGLVFSLGGDIFLMLDRRHFIKGLLSFLLAHLAYIVTFNLTGVIVNAALLLLAAAIGVAAFLLVRRIAAGLRASGSPSLIPPVSAYAVVLALTFWSTLTTFWRPEWPWAAPWLAAIGGGLFFISDSLLAWDRFVHPLPNGRLWTMLTYHLAQFGLTLSMLGMAFSKGDFIYL
jgi:alkenylglycerophosphocholine/alkenylglycerophosphoethanolamine hydrolase